MRDLEESLRHAVQDLADEAPHAFDLAGAARVQGRRIRRRRQVATGAFALALLSMVTVPYVWLRPEPPAPVVQPAPSVTVKPSVRALPDFTVEAPYRLPGGAIVTMLTTTTRVDDGEDEYTHVALDRDAGRYRQLPFGQASPAVSPDGERFAMKGGPDQIRILNADGDVLDELSIDTFSWGGSDPVWSPDGSRLLVPTSGGFAVYESGSRKYREFYKPDIHSLCSEFCSFSWLPNGREIAVPRRDVSVTRSEAHPDKIEAAIVYSADTGQRARSIPMAGVPVGNGAWSPDGGTVLVHEKTDTSDGIRVVDAVSGLPRSELLAGPDAIYLADGRILAFGNRYARIHAADGTLLEDYRMPSRFTDDVTVRVARS
ncbi:TolB family protein [Actinoplanes sp. CA-252034]|uniref:TolB family protein n=1 Tax=Actinoplanes sp. CA-252034 TaxID=3239906 RepID=UPI003D97404E